MRDDSDIYFRIEINNDDPNKTKNPMEWMDEEDEDEWEDLPNEDSEIEDFAVYQNKKNRFLSHYI
jgi:hypothetical protein